MLLRAWLMLIFLSLLATAVALSGPLLPPIGARLAGLAILLLSGIKAAIILSDYLELGHAPPIRRSFRVALGAFLLAAAGLYLAG